MSWRDPAKTGRRARERQRRTFERTAVDYDRYRPIYPDALFTDIIGYAGLAPHDRILEIGCGTGRATLPLARTGNPLLGIEPAPAMADTARAKLTDYLNVEIITSSFEDADIERQAFGLVACAQAYHWLDPATRVDRIADVLHSGGVAAIFAARRSRPGHSRTSRRRHRRSDQCRVRWPRHRALRRTAGPGAYSATAMIMKTIHSNSTRQDS